MSWIDAALVGAVLVGATAGTALVVRQPDFWIGLGKALLWKLLPIILKRKSPEEEAKDHQDVRQRTERTITGRERGR